MKLTRLTAVLCVSAAMPAMATELEVTHWWTSGGEAAAVAELHDMGVRVVMLSGDNQATATRIAGQLGIDTVIAEVLPADKAATITNLQSQGTPPDKGIFPDKRQFG